MEGVQDYFRDDVYWAYSPEQNFSASQESFLGSFDNWVDVTGQDRGFRLLSGKAAVPTVTQWGLVVLGVVLFGAIVVISRKRLTAAQAA